MVGEQKNKKMASVVFHVFSCLLGFIMIYPLLWLVASSFKSNDTMFKNTYSLLPESWGIIKNYNSGFASTTGYSFGHFFMNSAIVTVIGVVCTIFSFLLAAYAVSRVKFFGANFWFGCIIMTMMITVAADMTMTIIITITQMKCSQAGARKHLASIQRKKLRQSSRHLQRRTMNTALSFVQRVCCQARTVHGSTSIWFRKNMKSVKDSLNTPDVSA